MQSLAGIPIVMIIENAPGAAASYLWEYVKDMGPIIVMCEGGFFDDGQPKKIGVPKTDILTMDMYVRLSTALENNMVGYSERFSTVPQAGSDGRVEIKEKVAVQMSRFVLNVKKVYGEKHNNDLLVTIMMILLWREAFWRRMIYRAWIKANCIANQE